MRSHHQTSILAGDNLLFDEQTVGDIDFELRMLEQYIGSLRYWLFWKKDQPLELCRRSQVRGDVADYVRIFGDKEHLCDKKRMKRILKLTRRIQ